MYRKLSKGMYLCALRFLILEFPQNRLYNVSLNRIRIGYIPYLCEYYFAIFQDGCLKICIENCKNGVKRNEWQKEMSDKTMSITPPSQDFE